MHHLVVGRFAHLMSSRSSWQVYICATASSDLQKKLPTCCILFILSPILWQNAKALCCLHSFPSTLPIPMPGRSPHKPRGGAALEGCNLAGRSARTSLPPVLAARGAGGNNFIGPALPLNAGGFRRRFGGCAGASPDGLPPSARLSGFARLSARLPSLNAVCLLLSPLPLLVFVALNVVYCVILALYLTY